MCVDMSGAVLNSVILMHMTFEPLVQVACLRDVDWDPTSVFGLSGIDVIAGQRLEGRIDGKDLVLVLFPGLACPVDQSRSGVLRLAVTAK